MLNQTIEVRLILRKNKAKQGIAPIRIKYKIGSRTAEYKTGEKVYVDSWEPVREVVIGKSVEVKLQNQRLQQHKINFISLYQRLQLNGEDLDFESFRQAIYASSKEEMLLPLVEEYINRVKALIGIDNAKSTWAKYTYLEKKIIAFLKEDRRVADISLHKLNHKFLDDLQYFLKVNQGIGHNTSNKYIQHLKTILKFGVKQGKLKTDPFVGYRCTIRPVKRDFLTISEIQIIESKHFEVKRLEEVRDIFIFCCYTGLAYSDVEDLDSSNIVMGIDGTKWIHTFRKKTDVKSTIPILRQAQYYLDKYIGHPYCINKGKLLPVRSNQKMNAYLKEIQHLCGIQKKLTTHLARHTFASTILLNNGVPIESVSKMLGHTNIKTTQIYAKVMSYKISQDVSKIEDILPSMNETNEPSIINQKRALGQSI